MAPGTIVTFFERDRVEHNALIVDHQPGVIEATIVYVSKDATGRARVKQGTHPFYQEGMTERYIKIPPCVVETRPEEKKPKKQEGPPPPIESFIDAPVDMNTEGQPSLGESDEEDNIDGLGPLVKGQTETLE